MKKGEMISVDSALDIILNSVKQLQSEKILVTDSLNRILFSDIISDINVPSRDNSAMDGYAIRVEDVLSATSDKPAVLRISGEIQAGADPAGMSLENGCAVRIMTGAPVPAGCEAVAPFEDTEEKDGYVHVFKKFILNENVRFAGEDFSVGKRIIEKGSFIGAAEIGLMSSINIRETEVFKRPSVAVISTGDEICEPGEELKPGMVRNSNAYSLLSDIRKTGGVPSYLGIARDNLDDLREKFKLAMQHDIIVTSGGVSAGRYDFVEEVMRDSGIEIVFDKISMKPGKPLVFGKKGEKLFFGLPGNPVSTMIGFMEFIRPAILKMGGASKISKPQVYAITDDNLTKKRGRRHFLRGFFNIVDGEFHVSTTGPQGSGILLSMSRANCLVILPEEKEEIKKGERVLIQLIQHQEV